MRVEVVYALAKVQILVVLDLKDGATAADAFKASALPGQNPALAIHGRQVQPVHKLKDGDRVEILRPLAADPKEARRLRVRRAASAKRRQGA